MAINSTDKKGNKGLTAFFNKNFGRDEKGHRFVSNALFGPLDLMSCYTRDAGASPFIFITALLATMAPTGIIDAVVDNHATVENVAYETTDTLASNAISHVYEFNNKLYLVRRTDEGTQVFRQSYYDESAQDDMFVLIPASEAPDILRPMAEIYRGIAQQDVREIDIYSDFETVRENEPRVMAYEGISGVLKQEGTNTYYIIADNINTDLNTQWEATQQTAIEGRANIEAALTDVAYHRYITQGGDAVIGNDYNDINYPYWLIYAEIIGALTAGGALIGAANSVSSSRRRFNWEHKV